MPRSRLLVLLLLIACRRSPMHKVEDMRDELASDYPRWDGALPACGASRDTCARDVGLAIGTNFDEKHPDQISAATVAVLVARDRRGSDVGSPDVWITSMRKAKGPGADALRLAVALEMSRTVGKYARPLESPEDGRGFLEVVADAIPGACKTYARLGSGEDPAKMLPQDSPDHDACTQHDLGRKDGPGAGYGEGVFRAVAGALALWKDDLAALHDGATLMDPRYKRALDARLAVLDEATPKIAPKPVAAPQGNVWAETRGQHMAPLAGDAGR